jgi:hypothetical protein
MRWACIIHGSDKKCIENFSKKSLEETTGRPWHKMWGHYNGSQRKTGCEDTDLDRNQWQALVNIVINLRVYERHRISSLAH